MRYRLILPLIIDFRNLTPDRIDTEEAWLTGSQIHDSSLHLSQDMLSPSEFWARFTRLQEKLVQNPGLLKRLMAFMMLSTLKPSPLDQLGPATLEDDFSSLQQQLLSLIQSDPHLSCNPVQEEDMVLELFASIQLESCGEFALSPLPN